MRNAKGETREEIGELWRSRGACRPFNDSFASPGNFTSRLIDYFILFSTPSRNHVLDLLIPIFPLPRCRWSGRGKVPRVGDGAGILFYRRIAFLARDLQIYGRPDRITGNVLAAGAAGK